MIHGKYITSFIFFGATDKIKNRITTLSEKSEYPIEQKKGKCGKIDTSNSQMNYLNFYHNLQS